MNKKLQNSVETELKKEMNMLAKDIFDMYNGKIIHRFNRYIGGIRVDECIENVLKMYDIVKARDSISLFKIKQIVYNFINNELIAYGEIKTGNKIKVE